MSLLASTRKTYQHAERLEDTLNDLPKPQKPPDEPAQRAYESPTRSGEELQGIKLDLPELKGTCQCHQGLEGGEDARN